MERKPRVMIMAGGTGGHVFPALAVAKELASRGAEVNWLGTAKGIEARLVPEYGFNLETIEITGLRKKGALSWFAAPFRLFKAIRQAKLLLQQYQPNLVIGMGGFASGPGAFAAKRLGIPLVIHEQNAAAGLTNRLSARWAAHVLQAFPNTFEERLNAKTVGNPVREDILALPAPDERWANRQGPIRLLALGGSGGALAINEKLPAALAKMPEQQRPQVHHQAGRTLEAAQAAYAKHGVDADVTAFIDDMAAAYAWADVVMCRSGALTVAELAAAGVGALLVPYPYAVDDHQTANGQWLVNAGGAELIQQQDLSVERLAEELTTLCASRQQLLAKANNSYAVAWRDTTQQITEICATYLEGE